MLTHAEIQVQYDKIRKESTAIFQKKYAEYGATWTVYRNESMCDQLWIKAKRVRQLEEEPALINENREGEYMAMINYAITFLIKHFNPEVVPTSDDVVRDCELLNNIDENKVFALFDHYFDEAFSLYERKNHDYNDAWQDMSVKSITDFIITKILRIRHLLVVEKLTELDQQLYDIINYSIFALIKL